MLSRLAKLIRRTAGNPRYFVYFWRNVSLVKDHLPWLYRYFLCKRCLDLGGVFPLKRLHVVLRTTDTVMNLNASRKLEDVGIVTKLDVIRMGGCSLFPAARKFVERFGSGNLTITLVADNLSSAALALYRASGEQFGLSFDVVQARGHGNGPSFQTQIDVALKDDDETLELILEDDYMLNDDVLIVAFELLRNHSKVIGFNPHFHPDRIRFQDVGTLAVVDGRLYCRVPSTCCTFFMPHAAMMRYRRNLRLYDGWEKGSVGCAWEREVCLAPLGWTLAEHLHRSDLSPVNERWVGLTSLDCYARCACEQRSVH